jgi:diguanylate cyclase (GGDEF)-like protein/PAS domain S-box-containing protein
VTEVGQEPVRPSGHRAGHHVLAISLVLALVATAALAGVLIHAQQRQRRDVIEQRFNTRHVTASRFIEAYVRQIEAHEISVAKQALSGRVDQSDINELRRLSQLESAALYDGDGGLMVRSPSTGIASGGGSDASSGDGSDAGLESALGSVSSVTAAPGRAGDDAPTIAFAVPIQTPTGPRVFTGRLAVEDTLLRSFIVNALSAYRTGQVYLVTSSGIIIADRRRDDSGRRLTDAAAALARESTQSPQGFLPDREYYIAGPIDGTSWRLIFSLSSDELYETLTPSQRYAPWAGLVAFSIMALGLIRLFIRALAGRARAEDDHAWQEAILDTAGDAFVGTDEDGQVTDWNRAATELFGWTREEAMGRSIVSLTAAPDDPTVDVARLRDLLLAGSAQPRLARTLTLRHRDGRAIPVEMKVARTQWRGSWRFHAFIRDITERLEYERQLHELALTDSLTGLANRRSFLDQLERAHARHRRRETELAVIYADIDHFKAINDTVGHAGGDAVLRQVADRLRAHFRTEDTVGRLGGDEFAVIFEAGASQIPGLLDRLREALAAPYAYGEVSIAATVSVGSASPQDDESPEYLLERADRTMYMAKGRHHS